MSELYQQRVAMNEASFRKVNEGIASGSDVDPLSFICECGRLGCNSLIELPRSEYEAIRADPRRFALVPGHEIPEAERVVERREGYAVVEKTTSAGEVALHTDPRRPLD